MIKRFHSLYVGQIALDNIGLDGTPANDRRYSNERLSEVFGTARDVARVMDEEGYYALWTAEHHFQHEGYECLPNLIQLGLWLATQTKRLKFGCGFNILPMWHPIRLAEDYAMADIVTDGRVIMGVGRGYHTREVETFGAPLLDTDANREIFEEGLQLMLKCFNEELFRHKGKYFECPPQGALSRLPARRDHLCAAAEASAGRDLDADRQRPDHRHDGAIRHQGDGDVERRKDPRRRDPRLSRGLPAPRPGRAARAGHDLGRRPLSRRRARRRRCAGSSRRMTSATNGSRRSALCATPTSMAAPGARPGAPSRVPSLADGVEQKAWFCGTPEEVIDGIKSIEAKYPGLEDFMIHWAEGLPPDEFKDQLRWFARDVMPAFNRG